MQSIADLQILQLAQKAIELAQCLCFVLAVGDAAIAVDPGGARGCEDIAGERRHPARVAAQRVVIFVDQPFELGLHAIAAGAGQGRGQVVDDDRLRAPLGLGSLARIVDDERVEMR